MQNWVLTLDVFELLLEFRKKTPLRWAPSADCEEASALSTAQAFGKA